MLLKHPVLRWSLTFTNKDAICSPKIMNDTQVGSYPVLFVCLFVYLFVCLFAHIGKGR